MDWAVEVEIQFPVQGDEDAADARLRAKAAMQRLIRMGVLCHFHVLTTPRQVAE